MAKIYDVTESFFIRLVGTRGIVLLLIGTMWTFLGVGFLASPMERFSRPGAGGVLDFLDRPPGIIIFSSAWVLGGGLAIAAAIQRPRTCEDSWGFVGLMLPPFLWASGYWWSWLINIVSGGTYGKQGTYLPGLVYGALSLLLIFLSKHLPDHPGGPCARRHGGDYQ